MGEQKNISEFINDNAINFTNPAHFNREQEAQIFKKTFDLLNDTLSESSFKKFNEEKSRFEGKFLVTTYEATSIGIASNIERWSNSGLSLDRITTILKQRSREFWQDQTYLSSIGRGARFNTRARVYNPCWKTNIRTLKWKLKARNVYLHIFRKS